MSRTNHPKLAQIENRSWLPNRSRSSPRLTKLGGYYWAYGPNFVKAEGNQWQGTISDVGGDHRRRNQKGCREWKIIGRRIERRRLKERLYQEDSND